MGHTNVTVPRKDRLPREYGWFQGYTLHFSVEKGLMSIYLWKVAIGENIATFWGHTTDVRDLVFSPDGELLASGSYDGTILLWDMTSIT